MIYILIAVFVISLILLALILFAIDEKILEHKPYKGLYITGQILVWVILASAIGLIAYLIQAVARWS